MQKNIVICIQVRSNSKRLRNKCFKKINNKFLLEHCYLRLKTIKLSIPIYILTTKLKADDKIISFCKKNKIKYFRGDNNNVLKRYASFLKKFKFKNVIRVTADNIFIDIIDAKKLIKLHLKEEYDFSTSHLSSLPKGTGIDIFNTKSILELNQMNLKKSYKEHLSMFFLSKKNFFRIYKKPKKKNNNLNLSIDNLSDLDFIKRNFLYLKKIKNFNNIKKKFY
mgnify:CR=1 FL=1|tara:strand:+ start:405 stop:1070 length:666 start_codon:yes stop_codon:yes gene_type:complete